MRIVNSYLQIQIFSFITYISYIKNHLLSNFDSNCTVPFEQHPQLVGYWAEAPKFIKKYLDKRLILVWMVLWYEEVYTLFIYYLAHDSLQNRQLVCTIFLLHDLMIRMNQEYFQIIQVKMDKHIYQPPKHHHTFQLNAQPHKNFKIQYIFVYSLSYLQATDNINRLYSRINTFHSEVKSIKLEILSSINEDNSFYMTTWVVIFFLCLNIDGEIGVSWIWITHLNI